jgi:hypothetical protein
MRQSRETLAPPTQAPDLASPANHRRPRGGGADRHQTAQEGPRLGQTGTAVAQPREGSATSRRAAQSRRSRRADQPRRDRPQDASAPHRGQTAASAERAEEARPPPPPYDPNGPGRRCRPAWRGNGVVVAVTPLARTSHRVPSPTPTRRRCHASQRRRPTGKSRRARASLPERREGGGPPPPSSEAARMTGGGSFGSVVEEGRGG